MEVFSFFLWNILLSMLLTVEVNESNNPFLDSSSLRSLSMRSRWCCSNTERNTKVITQHEYLTHSNSEVLVQYLWCFNTGITHLSKSAVLRIYQMNRIHNMNNIWGLWMISYSIRLTVNLSQKIEYSGYKFNSFHEISVKVYKKHIINRSSF